MLSNSSNDLNVNEINFHDLGLRLVALERSSILRVQANSYCTVHCRATFANARWDVGKFRHLGPKSHYANRDQEILHHTIVSFPPVLLATTLYRA